MVESVPRVSDNLPGRAGCRNATAGGMLKATPGVAQMFEVVVFLACRRADPEGPRGPGALARLPYTLEGVSYTFRVDDPAAEPPFQFPELWFYLRFSRTGTTGFTRRFGLQAFAVNDDDSRTPVPYPANPPSTDPFDLGVFQFPGHSPVTSLTVVMRDLELPGRGRYEFRLLVRRRKPDWQGSMWRWVASQFIAVE